MWKLNHKEVDEVEVEVEVSKDEDLSAVSQ